MKEYQLQILLSVIILVALAGIKLFLQHFTNRILTSLQLASERKRIISKIINFFIIVLAIVLLTGVWGVDSQRLIIFITSSLTILGVAFVAQWSILSNITSSLILFFNHPIRIGGPIKILDKDYPLEGIVENISMFFLYIKTADGKLVSIPNTVLLQKIIALDPTYTKKTKE
ncbi:MAG: mechanosensitive ion channel domain-containing protein [Bacteroidales bacterium]|jgi:small-conductance mechanosensitive channel|nr:mechanosensitive ion channel family protein [Bacteroidales bacterium]MCK9448733.1 mechanosensitive ion channel family protein [Bacteroidales bacterium]MDD3702059.1 mechanosensitive ion channel [Bacteroidales bacterium]MDY0369694.1 mechanosensitive ion channel [Bacteroidales bacterium]